MSVPARPDDRLTVAPVVLSSVLLMRSLLLACTIQIEQSSCDRRLQTGVTMPPDRITAAFTGCRSAGLSTRPRRRTLPRVAGQRTTTDGINGATSERALMQPRRNLRYSTCCTATGGQFCDPSFPGLCSAGQITWCMLHQYRYSWIERQYWLCATLSRHSTPSCDAIAVGIDEGFPLPATTTSRRTDDGRIADDGDALGHADAIALTMPEISATERGFSAPGDV